MEEVIDCHVHVVAPADPFPQQPERHYLAAPASIDRLKQEAGDRVKRFVIVQPSFYGTDNRVTLAGVAALEGKGRAVAVIDQRTQSDAFLQEFHHKGVRGLRVNLNSSLRGDRRTLADEINWQSDIALRMGWHLQLVVPFQTLIREAELISRIPVKTVIDHYGLPIGEQPGSAKGRVLLELAKLPHVWVKLSAPYRVTDEPVGTAPPREWVKAFLQTAADRCVWGSDWPYTPLRVDQKSPDEVAPYRTISYSRLLDDFISELPKDLAIRVLRTNAELLYDFPP